MTEPDRKNEPATRREETLFQAATQLTGAERATYLSGVCHGDSGLRQRLEALLAAHDAKDSFLEPEPSEEFHFSCKIPVFRPFNARPPGDRGTDKPGSETR
jgi:hypothetical protein